MASITVIGTGFTGATQCFFGSTGVTIALNSAGTSFTCIPPAGTGTVNIGITSFGGNFIGSGSLGYTYMGSPTITNLGTTQGPMSGGTSVVISGTNFYDRSRQAFPGVGNTLAVLFGITASTGGIINSTISVTPLSPVSTSSGAVQLTLTTPTGSALTSGISFTYIAVPTLTSTSPAGASGPLVGGTRLRIIGTNLTTTSGVTMGGTTGATLETITELGVTLISPPSGTEGSKSITVTTIGGITSGITFTYVGLPGILSISPAAGTTSGSTVITISGSKLSNPRYVLFGITNASTLISNSGGETLMATSPSSLSAGLVDINVNTAGGTGTLSKAYTYVGPISITSIIPNRGPTGGG